MKKHNQYYLVLLSTLMTAGLASCNKGTPTTAALTTTAQATTQQVTTSQVPSKWSNVTPKSTPVHLSSMEDELKSSLNLYIQKDYESVPFIEMEDFSKFFSFYYEAYGIEDTFTSEYITDGFEIHRLHDDEVIATATFDFEEETLTFDHYDVFLCVSNSAANPLNLQQSSHINSIDEKYNRNFDYLYTSTSRYIDGLPVVVYFGDYDIPNYTMDGKSYLPLQFASDFLIEGIPVLYNGKEVYYTTSVQGEIGLPEDKEEQDEYVIPLSDIGEAYYSVGTSDTRDSNLIDFSYKKLCLNLDYHYGLQEKHGIVNFDDFFIQTRLKENYYPKTQSPIPKPSIPSSPMKSTTYIPPMVSMVIELVVTMNTKTNQVQPMPIG